MNPLIKSSIKLNCDLGESFGAWHMGLDPEVMPLIDQANIACGFHAGNVETMKQTVELCMQHGVSIGAHPSWPDRENFGRTEMQRSSKDIYTIVTEQLNSISRITNELGGKLHHVFNV